MMTSDTVRRWQLLGWLLAISLLASGFTVALCYVARGGIQ